MIDRACIESKDNWQCMVQRMSPGVREPFDCLMRMIGGGCYWCTPDYQGLFPWGTTSTLDAEWTRAALANGTLKLGAGTSPACPSGEQAHA